MSAQQHIPVANVNRTNPVLPNAPEGFGDIDVTNDATTERQLFYATDTWAGEKAPVGEEVCAAPNVDMIPDGPEEWYRTMGRQLRACIEQFVLNWLVRNSTFGGLACENLGRFRSACPERRKTHVESSSGGPRVSKKSGRTADRRSAGENKLVGRNGHGGCKGALTVDKWAGVFGLGLRRLYGSIGYRGMLSGRRQPFREEPMFDYPPGRWYGMASVKSPKSPPVGKSGPPFGRRATSIGIQSGNRGNRARYGGPWPGKRRNRDYDK